MEDLTRRAMLALILCTSLGSVLTMAANNRPIFARPMMDTTWTVTYESEQKVTAGCGKYYASYFLQKFLNTHMILTQLCNNTITIAIDKVARVRITQCESRHRRNGNKREILLSTFLKFVGDSTDNVLSCVAKLNQTFQNVSSVANVSMIPKSDDTMCSMANLKTKVLSWNDDDCRWTCQANWKLINQTHKCSAKALGNCSLCFSVLQCFTPVDVSADNACEQIATAISCVNGRISENPAVYHDCWAEAESKLNMIRKAVNCSNIMVSLNKSGSQGCSLPASQTTSTAATTAAMNSVTDTTTTTSTTTAATTRVSTTQPPMTQWHVNFSSDVETIDGEPTFVLYEGETRNLTFSTWANKTAICGEEVNCIIYMEVSFDRNSNVNCNYNESESIDQVVVGRPLSSRGAASNNDNFCKSLFYSDQQSKFPTDMEPVSVTFSLRGRTDFTYDNSTIRMTLMLSGMKANVTVVEPKRSVLNIKVMDRNNKATCQSINDPHITTFDGHAYDNLYQGEYVLYKHRTLPFQVNAIYQSCSVHVSESCNCAVAIKSGDDVIVFSRCVLDKKPFLNLQNKWVVRNSTILTVTMYLRGQLTPGTTVYQADAGLKYYVYLPSGTYIKIKTSGELLNVWVLGSSTDWNQTEGLCGTYNGDTADDLTLLNGTIVESEKIPTFIKSWQVPLYGEDSLLLGLSVPGQPYEPALYSVCSDNSRDSTPLVNSDVQLCNLLSQNDTDVTKDYVEQAPLQADSQQEKRRRRRELSTFTTTPPDDPIVVNGNFVPNAEYPAVNDSVCSNSIQNSTVGRLCSQVPNVNFMQEIMTCLKDIAITGGEDWVDSAEDAMKEQCLEELKRNKSIDKDLVKRINDAICPNKCSDHGMCMEGICECSTGFSGVDCSGRLTDPPETAEIKDLGLCNVEKYDCSRAIIYGDNFINSPLLVCLLIKAIINEQTWSKEGDWIEHAAKFLNFNAVECGIPSRNPYVITVSNDGGKTKSEPLLFIPYDGRCFQCSSSEKNCNQTVDTCVIEGFCYSSLTVKPDDQCQACLPKRNKFDWSSLSDCTFTDAVVISIAAIVGSLVGIAIGVLLYIICCRRKTLRQKATDDYSSQSGRNGFKPTLSDDRLHRNRELHPSQFPRGLDSRHRDYREPYLQNYGQGVENGVDDTTYF